MLSKVTQTAEGYVDHDFIIVHKNGPGLNDRGCDPGNRSGWVNSLDVADYLGSTGQARLLEYLSYGPLIDAPSRAKVRDLNEFVDLFRRLQTPYYEDARRRFNDEDVRSLYADSNGYSPYTQNELKSIASDNGQRRPMV